MLRTLQCLGMTCLLLSGCASTEYVGSSYPPTSHVDVFFTATDIGRPYSVMGTATTEGSEYMSFEQIEQQLVKDAMAKGADALIIDDTDTVKIGTSSSTSQVATPQPRYVVTADGKLKKVGDEGHASTTITTELHDKRVKARLIKYR